MIARMVVVAAVSCATSTLVCPVKYWTNYKTLTSNHYDCCTAELKCLDSCHTLPSTGSWVELSWVELSWVELSWVELSWVELSWVELSLTDMWWLTTRLRLAHDDVRRPTTDLTILSMSRNREPVGVIPANQREVGRVTSRPSRPVNHRTYS